MKKSNNASSTVTRDYSKPINLQELNILVGWRIEDNYGNYIDFEGKIFPKIYYYSSVRNPIIQMKKLLLVKNIYLHMFAIKK